MTMALYALAFILLGVIGADFKSAIHVSVSVVSASPQVAQLEADFELKLPASPDRMMNNVSNKASSSPVSVEQRSIVAPPSATQLTRTAPGQLSVDVAGLPFPQWLTDFTGITEWPGMDPPYIPLDFIDFKKIPDFIKPYQQGECDPAMRYRSCLFDCYNCAAFDDVYTCPVLLQTFDDGPSMATLDLLPKLRQPSTFFALGINIVRFPQVYRETVARGHVMGSHTWSHKFLPSLSNEDIVAQIQWLGWAMNATSGHLPKWFRPPYGGIDDRVRAIYRQFGMQAVLWDFDTTDWKLLAPVKGDERREEDIYRDLEKFKHDRGGRGLILEHDGVDRTVRVGIEINNRLLSDVNQMTVPECVGGKPYIKTFN